MNDSKKPLETVKRSDTDRKDYWRGFLNAMAKLEEAFGKEMTENRAAIYFESLHIYSIAEIEGAINRAIREKEFFPVPATLIKFIEEEREEKRSPSVPLIENKEEDRLAPEEAKRLFKIYFSENEKKEKAEAEAREAERQLRRRNEEKRRAELKEQMRTVMVRA